MHHVRRLRCARAGCHDRHREVIEPLQAVAPRLPAMKRRLRIAIGLLPHSTVKLWLMRTLLGWSIGPGCVVGPIVADIRSVTMAAGARIGAGNVFRNMDTLTMGPRARIGHWNWITAAADFAGCAGYGTLTLEEEVAITSSHVLDCAAEIRVGRFTAVGGKRSTFLTHQLDYESSLTMTAPIRIGAYCLVNANVCITPGRVIADKVVIAMGAVVVDDLDKELTLYAGVPAVAKKPIHGRFFSRTVSYAQPKHKQVATEAVNGAQPDGAEQPGVLTPR